MQDNAQASAGQPNNELGENQSANHQSNNNKQNQSHNNHLVRVQISHIDLSINKNQSDHQNEQIHLQCNLKYSNQTFQTHSVQEQQSLYKWSDQFTIEAKQQDDDQQLEIEVYEKDDNQNQLFGKAKINLEDFLSDLKEYQNQKVEISNNGQIVGELTYTAKSYINEDQQNQYQEPTQHEQHNKQQNEHHSQQKQEETHDKEKQIEHEQQQQTHHEQNKKEHNKNELEHQEINNKIVENENKQDNEEHNKKTVESELNKEEHQNSKLNSQNESSMIDNSKIHQKKTVQDKSLNESIVSNKKNFDYNPAAKNLKSGYGLSEYHSAHTLQTSIHSMSFPKGQRFQQSTLDKPSAPYAVLPSSFDNNNSLRGPSFGYGNRDLLHLSSNPGPGSYNLSTINLKKGSKKGFIFGVSRSQCKNAIGLLKSDMAHSQSTRNINQGGRTYDSLISKDFSNGLKLPALNGSLSSRNLPNYHYSRQKQF
ncbi:hypothetical protein ABPG74_009743 [Tetrahymena malaccensis]